MKQSINPNKAHKPKPSQQFSARGGMAPRYCILCGEERGTVKGKFIKHYNNRRGGVICDNSGQPAPSIRSGRGGLFKDIAN